MRPYCVAIAAAIASVLAAAAPVSAQQQPDLTPHYPSAALSEGVAGLASVRCDVGPEGVLACEVTQEMPLGRGFGQAALDVSRGWSMQVEAGAESGTSFTRTVLFRPGPPPQVTEAVNVPSILWIERPSARDFVRLYPRGALHQWITGQVALDCIVKGDYRLDCRVASEEPGGYGFAEATLELAQAFRIAPQALSGAETAGGRVRVNIRWNIAN